MSDTKRKASIDCDRRLKERGGTEYEGGWYFYECKDGQRTMISADRFETYDAAKKALAEAGYEFGNGGWRHRLLMWNWHSHAMDDYPGWDLEGAETYGRRHPAFVKLTHRRGKGNVESHDLAAAWDDIATVDFYQRDWTDDGIPFVCEDTTYWSGWWFATIAERDRFVTWAASKGLS